MTYSWKCAACEQVMEVERKLADIDVGPESCECGSTKFTGRVILPPRSKRIKGFILEGDRGWHHTDYHQRGPKDW